MSEPTYIDDVGKILLDVENGVEGGIKDNLKLAAHDVSVFIDKVLERFKKGIATRELEKERWKIRYHQLKNKQASQ